MGLLDSRVVSGAGILSALLFIMSGALIVIDGGSTPYYVAAAAGVLAIVFSIGSLTSDGIFAGKVSGAAVALTGVISVVTAFAGGASGLLVSVVGLVATVAMMFDALNCWVSKVKGLMTVSGLFAVVELIISVVSILNLVSGLGGCVFIVLALWILVSVVSARVLSVPAGQESKEDDAGKDHVKKPGSGKKESPEKPEHKPEPVKADKNGKPSKKVESDQAKIEPKPVIPEKVEVPAKKVEPAKNPEVKGPVGESSKKVESKPTSVSDPKSVPPKSNNDFMGKLVASKNVHRAAPAKVEPPRKVDPPVKETADEVPAPKDDGDIVTVTLPAESKVEIQEVPAEGSVSTEEPAVTSVEDVQEESETLPEVQSADDAHVDTVMESQSKPAQVMEHAEELISVDTEPVEVRSETEVEDVHVDVPDVDPSSDGGMSDEPVTEEVLGTESADEVPDDVEIQEQAVPTDSDNVDASSVEYRVSEEPVEVLSDSECEPVPDPDEGVVSEENHGTSESSEDPISSDDVPSTDIESEIVPDNPPMEPQVEVRESQDDSDGGQAQAPEGAVVSDPIASVQEESSEDEALEDIFTDYSPEALVRRAAWNKGLRCRRGYGEHNIPVAFVKGKVAVYVEEADADSSIDDLLREEGWTVFRYDAALITDGKDQAEEIAQAVKSNARAVKSSSKKKKKSVKK